MEGCFCEPVDAGGGVGVDVFCGFFFRPVVLAGFDEGFESLGCGFVVAFVDACDFVFAPAVSGGGVVDGYFAVDAPGFEVDDVLGDFGSGFCGVHCFGSCCLRVSHSTDWVRLRMASVWTAVVLETSCMTVRFSLM